MKIKKVNMYHQKMNSIYRIIMNCVMNKNASQPQAQLYLHQVLMSQKLIKM